MSSYGGKALTASNFGLTSIEPSGKLIAGASIATDPNGQFLSPVVFICSFGNRVVEDVLMFKPGVTEPGYANFVIGGVAIVKGSSSWVLYQCELNFFFLGHIAVSMQWTSLPTIALFPLDTPNGQTVNASR